MVNDSKQVRVAILDLYEGQANEGMRCIREILNQFSEANHLHLIIDEFELRLTQQIPDLSYHIYISSGGPGSPLDSTNTEWENKYFSFLNKLVAYNKDFRNQQKKQVFFICHSFQLACRYFRIGEVNKRMSTAFGIFPVHLEEAGIVEPVFEGLQDPFYSVDSRDYQVVQPNDEVLRSLGASILAIEKERPHIPLERAIMAVRFNENMIGTQFHPEADAIGMTMYLERADKKKTVIENHGEEKWQSMIDHLNDPDKILWTYSTVLPNFLKQAVESMQGVEA